MFTNIYFRALGSLLCASVMSSFVWYETGLLTGAEHGHYGPFMLIGAPRGAFFLLWPLVIGLLATNKKAAAVGALSLLFFHLVSIGMENDIVSSIVHEPGGQAKSRVEIVCYSLYLFAFIWSILKGIWILVLKQKWVVPRSDLAD